MTAEQLVATMDEYWHDDQANLIAVDQALMAYEQNPEQYKKEKSGWLCREMLKIACCGEAKELHYFLSAIVEVTGNRDVYIELIRLCMEDNHLSKEQRFFAYCQLMRYRFTHPETNCGEILELLDDLYEKIYQAYHADLADLFCKIPQKLRNKDLMIVITSQVLSGEHGPTKALLDRCYILASKMNKSVFIINTADTLPNDKWILWYKIHKGSYKEELCEEEYLSYKGYDFAYFQCPDGVPDVSIIREIMGIIAEEKPWCIISLGGENLTADLCSEIVPVLTVGLGSDRAECRTTFQTTGHKMNPEDVAWIQKNRLPKDHNIEGIFTFALKKQKYQYERPQLGLPDDKTVCLVVGSRLDDEITEQFAELLSNLIENDIYIAVVGIVERFARTIKEMGKDIENNILLLGHQEDTMAVCECCDIYLNPKRLGGGTTAAEALYKGVPVITQNYGDVAVGVGEEFWVKDYDEMYAETMHLIQDREYYRMKSDKAKERAKVLMDSETEFVRIIKEMESRESFF